MPLTTIRAELMVSTTQSTLQLRGGPLWATLANALYIPKASCKYFCPTSFRYSSIALVASVFSLKMRCSFSPQRSTSDIIRSVKKSWKAKPMVGHHALTYTLLSRAAASPSAERSHLRKTREGVEVLQVILCVHAALLPARLPSCFSNLTETRGEINLWRVTTFAPPKNDSFQTCITFASPSAVVFGCVSYQPYILWVKHFLHC